jgi:DNA-binding NarL/FixJ family response regulator
MASGSSKSRVVVADDHPMVRDGIVALLDAGGFDVVGEAEDSERAITICEVRRPDLLLLDYELPPGDAPTVIVAVRERAPEVRILVFTAFQEADRARAVLEIGADGFVTKGLRGPALIDAVNRVLSGKRVVTPEIERLLGEEPQPALQPSERQRTVIEAVARGGTNREIAEELEITERTVKYHLRVVFDRLGASNRAEAVARAVEAGWLLRE